MALNHFASQVREKQTRSLSAGHNHENTPEKPVASKASNHAHATRNQRQTATNPIVSNAKASDETQAANDTINPSLREIPLSWSDQQMLCAMSAMQIRYGRPAEAIPYLMMIRKINPKNVECARLLALSFMRLGRWQEAETMVEEYDFLQKSQQTGVVDGLVLLYRSLISYKTSKIAEARSWFGKFRKFNKVS